MRRGDYAFLLSAGKDLTMFRTILVLSVVVLGVSAGCARTTYKHQDTKALIAEMQAHNADPKNSDNKYVCREEIPTGTNIPIVVCRTERDIRLRSINDRLEFERLVRRSRGN
jgi:hypothetical protein